jgi:hypothetical protein
MQADDTLTNANNKAQMKARGRFMVGLLPVFLDKALPFASTRRLEIPVG